MFLERLSLYYILALHREMRISTFGITVYLKARHAIYTKYFVAILGIKRIQHNSRIDRIFEYKSLRVMYQRVCATHIHDMLDRGWDDVIDTIEQQRVDPQQKES